MSIFENPRFLQAEDDLKMAKLAFANGFYSQTCYHASQSAEKALKSIIIDLGELPPPKKTHALNRLKGMLSQLGLHTSDLEDLKLNFLTRMHTSLGILLRTFLLCSCLINRMEKSVWKLPRRLSILLGR